MMLSIPTPSRQATLVQPHQSSSQTVTPLLTVPIPPLQQPRRPMRPVLSINTQQNRTFGKGSSLRLETLSAVSPTIRNTFSNGYEPTKQSEESIARSTDTPITPAESGTPSSVSSASEASTILEPHVIPYTQPHGLKSALFNSPIPRTEYRRMSIGMTKAFFPPQKRVSFKEPLTEEIQTTKYTVAHIDIVFERDEPEELSDAEISSNASDCSTATLSSSEASSVVTNIEIPSGAPKPASSPRLAPRRVKHRRQPSLTKLEGPQVGEKRDSSSDESDSDKCPETPVAGRRKRVREWTWTLGPLPGAETTIASIDSAETSPEVAATDFTIPNDDVDEYLLSPQATTLPICFPNTSPWSSTYPTPELAGHGCSSV